MLTRRGTTVAVLAIIAGMLATACTSTAATTMASPGASGDAIAAVGAENEYANVIAQIGGRYVSVTSIESNPNTDPHTLRGQPERRPGGQRAPSSSSRTASATTTS